MTQKSSSGPLFIARAPHPLCVMRSYLRKNYPRKYSSKRSFEEWVQLCESIVEAGGEVLILWEDDEEFLDHKSLHIGVEGSVYPHGSNTPIAHVDEALTDRVLAGNGPWVHMRGSQICALMPHLRPNRLRESSYYDRLLSAIADDSRALLKVKDNPHRWEGMADVIFFRDKALLTFARPGLYDGRAFVQGQHSTFEGVAYAADFAGISENDRIYLELAYPALNGRTVICHLSVTGKGERLTINREGLGQASRALLRSGLKPHQIWETLEEDEQSGCAASLQVGTTLIANEDLGFEYELRLENEKMRCIRRRLRHCVGGLHGAPAWLTLALPKELNVAENFPLRFSQQRDAVVKRLERMPSRITVDPEWDPRPR